MIEIKTLSLLQGNPQNNDQITDFEIVLHNRHNNFSPTFKKNRTRFLEFVDGMLGSQIGTAGDSIVCKTWYTDVFGKAN